MRQLEPSPEPEQTISENQKKIEVVIGFVAWYVINGLLWLPTTPNHYPLMSVTCSLPGNIVVLLICAIHPHLRRMALGILIAMALNFFISLLFGMFLNVLCFVPFFTQLDF